LGSHQIGRNILRPLYGPSGISFQPVTLKKNFFDVVQYIGQFIFNGHNLSLETQDASLSHVARQSELGGIRHSPAAA
jgi:hypothetical protein